MPTAIMTPGQERQLLRYAININQLTDTYGILTPTLVQAATSVDDLIARAYAALTSSGTALFGPEARMLVRIFEQGIRFAQAKALIDDTLAAALSTVNTVNSGTTDLRWLLAGALSDSTLDYTLDNDPYADTAWADTISA